MVAIISRPGRTQQPLDLPGIDRSNALGGKVESLILRGVNLTNGRVAAWSGTKKFAANAKDGLVTSLDGSSYLILTNVGLYAPATAPVTLAFYSRTGTPASVGGTLRISPTGASNAFCAIRGTSSSYRLGAGYAIGGTLPMHSGIGVATSNTVERTVITCANGLTSTTAADYEIWINGTKYTTSGPIAFGAQTAGATYFGWDGADSKYPGTIDELVIFDGKLSDAEVTEYFRNPYQMYTRPAARIWVSSGSSSGSTGTSATTNAADTSSASGTTTVTGSSAKTNANDTSSASGTTTVTGTSAKTNADDTSSASGAVGSNVTGTSATTNAADTSAASGTTTVVGTSAKTNSNDTASANGTTTVVGTSEQTNANDTATASGAAGAIVGTAAVTNAADAASASGTAQGGALSGGWKRAGQKKKQRRKPVDIEGFDQPDSPARVEAPQPEQVETSEAIPAKDASTKERQPSPVELLMRAIDSARESAKTELRAEFKALVDEERQRVRSERIARAVENSRSVHERELRKADELRTKAIAKSAQEEEDAVAKLLMQRQKAARQAIAQAQKHLISLLNLKEPAL